VTDIPGPATPPGDGEDALAREEDHFLREKLEPPALIEARHRTAIALLEIKHAFFRGIRIVCAVLPFVGFAMLLVWIWHIIAPDQARWLSTDEINHLQALIFSGAISALITAIATKAI
jgi:hypothetical protein